MKVFINMLMFREELDGTGYYIRRLLKQLQVIDTTSEYILLFPKEIRNPKELFQITNKNFSINTISVGKNPITRIFVEQFYLPIKVHCGVLYSPSVSLPLLPMFFVKKVTTIHDLIPFYYPQKYPFIQRIYYNFITRLSAKVSKVILTVSKNTKEDLVTLLKIPENKIKIIYNFLDSDYTNKYVPYSRENYFITVSRIQPGKNLEGIIYAFHEFIKVTKSDKRLFIIGGYGWKCELIFDLVKKLKLSDRIIFKGYLAEEELIQNYKNSSGLIYLSFYEGFGIPPLEALSFGCPVLVSNNSSLPEVTGKAAIYANPYNIESIVDGLTKLDDKNIVLQKSKFFEEEVKKFNAEIETMKLLNCFKSLVK